MQKLSFLDWVALVLVIVGGINWGLVGLFQWDLMANIFGDMSGLSRIIYVLVGLGGLWMLFISGKLAKR